jgi:hypothetical protein
MKYLLTIAAVFAMACSGNTKTDNEPLKPVEHINTDTIYSTNTSQLKSAKIPDSVFNMTQLKHLYIRGMDCDYGSDSCWMLREIPAAIGRLTQLESIRFNVNSIASIPPEIKALTQLRSLNLDDNIINDITTITSLPNLESLSLFGCHLTRLPQDIGVLKNLKYLGLTGNNLAPGEIERARKALPRCEIIYVAGGG